MLYMTERLTELYTYRNEDDFICSEFVLINKDIDGYDDAVQKLGLYEDLEEQEKISILTLFKARDVGKCYFKNVLNEIIEADVDEIELYKHIIRMHERRHHNTHTYTEPLYEFLFKDYGRKWALTAEELQ